jgi:ribosomal protein L31E
MKGTEAEYIIPLRKEVMKVAKYDRTKKAVIAIRQYLQKHTKSKNVLLGKQINKKLQSGGRKNVVSKIHVKVIKDEDNYRAELIGHPIELSKDKEDKNKKAEKPKVEAKKEVTEKPVAKEEAKAETKTVKKVVKKVDKKVEEKK